MKPAPFKYIAVTSLQQALSLKPGNAGVGEATATIAMFCRRQKGRHFTGP